MKIKICGIKTAEDIQTVIDSDADAAGFLIGQLHASKDFVLPSTAARLVEMLPPYVSPVIFSDLFEIDPILEIVLNTGIRTIQLHGKCSVDEVKKLRDSLPLNSKLIISTYVVDNCCEPEPSDYYSYVDAILLDCYNKEPGMIGIKEKEPTKYHNWAFAAEFVKKCPLPVILAGGLSTENVAEAIKTVMPFGIDANNGLRDESTGDRSLKKCREFVRKTRITSTSIIPSHFER